MEEKTKAKMMTVILDGMGYPFHENSVELTSLNKSVKEAMGSIVESLHDEFIEYTCNDCEFSCNENNCEKRHNN